MFDDPYQVIGSDVRLGLIENFVRSAGGDKFVEHLAHAVVFVFDLRGQLAVGEGTRAAFAERDIRFGIQHAVFPEGLHVFNPADDIFAAFDENRFGSRLRQQQRGHQSARPAADNDGGDGRLSIDDRRLIIDSFDLRPSSIVNCRCDFNINRINRQDAMLLPRIDRPADDGVTDQLRGLNAQLFGDGFCQCRIGVVKR